MRRLSSIVFLLCGLSTVAAQPGNTDFTQFIQRYSDEWMRFHTDIASTRHYFSGGDQETMSRQIEPVTRVHRQSELQLIDRGLATLKTFDRSKLSVSDQRTSDIVLWDLSTRRANAEFYDYSFPFAHNRGVDSSLIQLLTVSHAVRTARDADSYLARLATVPQRMDEAIAEGRRLAAAHLLPPKFILQVTAAHMRGFLDMPPDSNPFVTTFVEKLAAVNELPPAQRDSLRAAAAQITAAQIYPAWRRALDLVEGEIPYATDDAGWWRFPNGAEAYRAALARYTTTTMTPDEVHETGLKMVSEIEARMDSVLRQMGYSDGPLRARMETMKAAQPQFPSTAEGRAQYRAMITDIITDAQRRASVLFERVPRMPVTARPYPSFMGGRAASYSLGTTDGSRPGVYQYPEYDVTLTRFGARTTAYHEAVPGHHFQLALQAENDGAPKFVRDAVFGSNSANGEGWGLYAEHLVAEQGWYEGDPAGLLGQLEMELFRAHRLVIDTGLHAKKWTRQQAVEYLGPLPGLSAESEIDRYVSDPGQACSYMVGELKIIELRARAKAAVGANFSLAEFHTRVLDAGRVPLSVLEQDIDRWIAARKG
jgi:uncharacterized protein (DUF885 family)